MEGPLRTLEWPLLIKKENSDPKASQPPGTSQGLPGLVRGCLVQQNFIGNQSHGGHSRAGGGAEGSRVFASDLHVVLSDLSRAPAGDSVSAFLPAPHPPFVSILETLKQRDGWLLCWLSLQGPFFCVRIILTNH